jgi:hypothetical protein
MGVKNAIRYSSVQTVYRSQKNSDWPTLPGFFPVYLHKPGEAPPLLPG